MLWLTKLSHLRWIGRWPLPYSRRTCQMQPSLTSVIHPLFKERPSWDEQEDQGNSKCVFKFFHELCLHPSIHPFSKSGLGVLLGSIPMGTGLRPNKPCAATQKIFNRGPSPSLPSLLNVFILQSSQSDRNHSQGFTEIKWATLKKKGYIQEIRIRMRPDSSINWFLFCACFRLSDCSSGPEVFAVRVFTV